MSEPTTGAVVKVGGREIAPGGSIDRLVTWVAQEHANDRRLVLVHGGGEEVSERANALGLPVEKRAGQRVTSAPMLEVVVEVLAGRVNGRIVARLASAGLPSVGLTGASGRLIEAELAGDPAGSLGFVGRPTRVHPALLEHLLDRAFVPVVAPLAIDRTGELLNINADLAASAIASAMRFDLLLVTDVPAVLDSERRPIAELTGRSAQRLIESGVARDGMRPKLEAAGSALGGAPSVWIGDLDGLTRTEGRSGTFVRPDPAKRSVRARPAAPGGR